MKQDRSDVDYVLNFFESFRQQGHVDKLNNQNRVEVQSEGDKLVVACRQLNILGGAYNFEEAVLQTYNFDRATDEVGNFEAKAGDAVVVGFLNGDPREGLILGGLSHTSRQNRFELDDGPQYVMSVNGLEREINKDGEYTVTFKGQPTNASVLSDKPTTEPIPEPEYDEEVGSTFFKFDVEGGWTVSDNATSDPQSVHVNKSAGTITITSGAIILTMTKGEEATSLTTKTLTVDAADAITNNTKDWRTEASATAVLKSPKVAIGTDGTELLDQIVKLIDALGAQTIITPVGPATPIQGSPQWSQVAQIKSAINGIKGKL